MSPWDADNIFNKILFFKFIFFPRNLKIAQVMLKKMREFRFRKIFDPIKCYKKYVEILLRFVRLALYPSFHFCNNFLMTHIETFEDKRNGGISFAEKCIYSIVYLTLLACTVPIFLIFFSLRIILLYLRKPYQYSEKLSELSAHYSENFNENIHSTNDIQLSIATANVLLLQECASRFNNIKNVRERGEEIGKRIVNDQLLPQHPEVKNGLSISKGLYSNTEHSGTDHCFGPGGIVTHFTSLDFICFQETFSNYDIKTLIKELHKVYPYIVHDVGVNSFSVNKFIVNSGLMLASRFPISDVDFKPYGDFVWPCRVVSSGVLMAKVIIHSGKPLIFTFSDYIYFINILYFFKIVLISSSSILTCIVTMFKKKDKSRLYSDICGLIS